MQLYLLTEKGKIIRGQYWKLAEKVIIRLLTMKMPEIISMQ
jgi:hypothetical protein